MSPDNVLFLCPGNPIANFHNLPLAKLDKLSLQARLNEIGQGVPKPA